MTHVLPDLAKERQRDMLADALAVREGRRAVMHGRVSRRLQRLERRQTRHGNQAALLRAELERLESVQ
jgi:hypothetical protein